MQNKPLISIIAPCYNGEKYIQKFIDSIYEQTYSRIELIIINDGSTDKTLEIIKENIKRFEVKGYKLIIIDQENQGIGASINNAIKIMTGDYFTWFGCDDFALPTYSEELINFLENNKEYGVVRNDGYIVNEKNNNIILGKMADDNHDKHNEYLFENAILERNFHFGYSVVRTEYFDKVNKNRDIYPSRHGQNWQLLLPIFYNYKSAFYEKPLYCVVDNINSVSRNPHKSYELLKKQNLEYETILNSVINSMNIKDKNKYLNMIKIKYIRRRMIAAFNNYDYETVYTEFKCLTKYKELTFRDIVIVARSKFKFINKLVTKLKK